jgi:flagellar protein FlgJ
MDTGRRLRAGLSGAVLALLAVGGVAHAQRDPAVVFVEAAGEAAQAVVAEFGVPASVLVAQAVLESAWGAADDHNYFGARCTAPDEPGPIATGCRAHAVTNCAAACAPETTYFRVYASIADSFRDHARVLATLTTADDPDRFVAEIAPRYSADPAYAAKVTSLMRDHDLYRFDAATPPPTATPSPTDTPPLTATPSPEVPQEAP